jgi:hypothetical protein
MYSKIDKYIDILGRSNSKKETKQKKQTIMFTWTSTKNFQMTWLPFSFKLIKEGIRVFSVQSKKVHIANLDPHVFKWV